MMQGREGKEDENEEGFTAEGPSVCLNNIGVVNWGIVLQESNHLFRIPRLSVSMDFRNISRNEA